MTTNLRDMKRGDRFTLSAEGGEVFVIGDKDLYSPHPLDHSVYAYDEGGDYGEYGPRHCDMKKFPADRQVHTV